MLEVDRPNQRIALGVKQKTSLHEHFDQFTQISGGRTIQQLNDTELRGYVCLLIAVGKRDEAKSALQHLLTRQPELAARHDFAHHHHHLGGSDVEPDDQVFVFFCHVSTCSLSSSFSACVWSAAAWPFP